MWRSCWGKGFYEYSGYLLKKEDVLIGWMAIDCTTDDNLCLFTQDLVEPQGNWGECLSSRHQERWRFRREDNSSGRKM